MLCKKCDTCSQTTNVYLENSKLMNYINKKLRNTHEPISHIKIFCIYIMLPKVTDCNQYKLLKSSTIYSEKFSTGESIAPSVFE